MNHYQQARSQTVSRVAPKIRCCLRSDGVQNAASSSSPAYSSSSSATAVPASILPSCSSPDALKLHRSILDERVGNRLTTDSRRPASVALPSTTTTTTMTTFESLPAHFGPEQPKIQTEVLGHSLVRSLVRSHRSLPRLLRTARFARALRCAHSFARSLTSLTPSIVGQ